MNKDYKVEHKPILDHAGKDKAKLLLAQEFEHIIILACKPVQVPLFALTLPVLTSASQKSTSNPLKRQKRSAQMAKNPECQVPNPDIFYKNV